MENRYFRRSVCFGALILFLFCLAVSLPLSGREAVLERSAVSMEEEKGGVSPQMRERLLDKSASYAMQMAKGDFSAVHGAFTPSARSTISREKLKQAFELLSSAMGDYKKIRSLRFEKLSANFLVYMELEYEHSGIALSFFYNGEELIENLWMNQAFFSADRDGFLPVSLFSEADFAGDSMLYVRQAVQGEWGPLYERMAPEARAAVSEEMLEAALRKAEEGMGECIGLRLEELGDRRSSAVAISSLYEKGRIFIQFFYDDQGAVGSFFLRPILVYAEPAESADFYEIPVEIGEGKRKLGGFLTVPKGKAISHTAVLVHGSGPQDMDSTVGASKNKPFRDLAYGLAREGIAVLRYHKRTYQYPEVFTSASTISDEMLDDAGAAVELAERHPLLDKSSVVVIGLSLGGMMGPAIAAENRSVAGLVLMAGSPRKLEDIILEQNRRALELSNMDAAGKERHMEEAARVAEKIRTLEDGVSEALYFGASAAYWRSLNAIDVPAAASKLAIPVLAVQGEADFQISPDRDYGEWKKLARRGKNWTFILYPGLNHLFMPASERRDVGEYDRENHVDEKVLRDLGDWIKRI